MNPRALIPLVAGLGIGGLALKLGISTLQDAKAGHGTSAKVRLWSAREDIPRGTEIAAEMLQELAFPADAIPPGAFKAEDKEKLLGRIPRLVAPAGLPILESMLCSPGTRPGIFPKPGLRAIAVKIDASSGVDYHIEPGCFVDVLGSFPVKGSGTRGQMIAKTVVENVEVAAVGPRTSPSSGKDEPDKNPDRNVRAVTLFVTPEQAKKILLAEQQGPFKLCMRGSDGPTPAAEPADEDDFAAEPAADDTTPSPALAWLRELFNKPTEPPPPAQPIALATTPALPLSDAWVLKIFRGHDEETIRFKDRTSNERIEGPSDDAATLFGDPPRPASGTRGLEPHRGQPPQPQPQAEEEAKPEERRE